MNVKGSVGCLTHGRPRWALAVAAEGGLPSQAGIDPSLLFPTLFHVRVLPKFGSNWFLPVSALT